MQLGDWKIRGNILMRTTDEFYLIILMGAVGNMEYDEEIEEDPAKMVFILKAFDLEEKQTDCIFESLEDVMFFVDSYLYKCHNVADIDNRYRSYCVSQNVSNHGLSQ